MSNKCGSFSVENFACGICGKLAAFFYLYGYRCKEHRHEKTPTEGEGGRKRVRNGSDGTGGLVTV